MKRWTLQEVNTLRQLYKTNTRNQISSIMGIPVDAIRGALNRYNIQSGRITQFQQGVKPWNTDLNVRTNAGNEFKKGNEPHNTLYDGAVRLRSNKYYYIRLAKGVWKLYQRYVWEQHNGPVPAGMLVTFVDGNSLNCNISNLAIIPTSQIIKKNANRTKAGKALKELYRRERLRKKYGLSPLSGHYNRLNQYANPN